MKKQQGIVIDQRHLHEECGIFGASCTGQADLARLTYYGLFALQHRGQESAGIVLSNGNSMKVRKAPGLINDVFSDDDLNNMGEGNIAVGHVRYSTSGADLVSNAQPVVVNHHDGSLAIAHNGNLTNSYTLRNELEEKGAIFHSSSDTEVIAYIIVQERLKHPSIEDAVSAAMDRIEGAYSLIISSQRKLIALRDPFGFRPLCYGQTKDGIYIFASETCALDAVGAQFIRDLDPGEIAIVEKGRINFDRTHCKKAPKRLCVFEYIYFARPDSVIDGVSVSDARRRAGMFLAQEHPVDADIVIGVPDSGLEAAIGYANESGIPYGIGFTKNKYVARTFIAPNQHMREAGVKMKLNPIRSVVSGKRVVLVDDSIVRGTTSKRIVEQLREAGATEIHLRISAPPFVAACYYGTDVDSTENLIAAKHSVADICDMIGADSLGYLSTEHVVQLTGEDTGFCTACFGGEYPTALDVNEGKTRFEQN